MRVMAQVNQRAREQRIPVTVHFDLTYRCHQRCVHCYLPEAYRRGAGPGPELDTDQVKNILDQLAAAGTFFLTFSGGEIFLRPDLLQLVAYARRLNFSISLMSSGSMGIEAEQVRVLSDIGLEALFISLHSLEAETHDQISGAPGSWSMVWKVLQKCRNRGLRVVLNSQALRLNYRGLTALKRYALQAEIPLRMDDDLSPRWDGRPHPKGLALNPKESHWFHQEIGGGNGSGEREPATVPADPQEGGCGAGLSRGYINPQGELWPCLELPWPCGRLLQGTDFSRLWRESPILNWLRPLLSKDREVKGPFCEYLRKNRIKPDEAITHQ